MSMFIYSILISIAAIKHWPKASWRGKVYLASRLQSFIKTWPRQKANSRQEPETRIEAEATEECCFLACSLDSHSLLLYHPGPSALPRVLSPPITLTKKVPPKTSPINQSDWGFSQLKFLLQVTPFCIKLAKSKEHYALVCTVSTFITATSYCSGQWLLQRLMTLKMLRIRDNECSTAGGPLCQPFSTSTCRGTPMSILLSINPSHHHSHQDSRTIPEEGTGRT